MPTTEITLRGLRLEVEFDYRVFTGEAYVREVRHKGEEILCIMDDRSISDARREVERQIQEGKCHT